MRLLLVASLLAVAALNLMAATGMAADMPTPCPNPHNRREIRDLSDAERSRFFNAVRRLQVRPQSNQPSTFDVISYYHNGWSAYTHSVPPFLAYHRLLIDWFEKELQSVDASVTLPYWDWSLDAQAPELSPILSPTWFGTNGKGSEHCLQDSFYSDFRPYYRDTNQPSCLTRIYDGGNRIKAFWSPEMITDMVNNSPNFETFRLWIEGAPHGLVHNGLGGVVSTMYSSNDPVFYMHHAMIDKIWYDWQKVDPVQRIYQYYGYDASTQRQVDLNQFLPAPFSDRRVGDGVNVRAAGMCYKYLPPVNAARGAQQRVRRDFAADVVKTRNESIIAEAADVLQAAASTYLTANATNAEAKRATYTGPPADTDRTFIMDLRAPPPLPENWLRMNRLDIDMVRGQEQRAAQLCDRLNRQEGYVSPSALWNRPSFLEKLAKAKTQFQAYIGNKLVRVQDSRPENVISTFKQAGARVIESLTERKDALLSVFGAIKKMFAGKRAPCK
ncbi:hypothetical protein THASP1DRAFT_28640 [Thamnocephalis sphaerospora]|uniref:Tyrosinase copper-binding domain-containing protein n=1 Tax=Thamnocephalis sphaerospora TaxID=78915 RepID=A0A4P9XTQ3_9FUNG|nr:hypothetical protein THASP1DRAFT_28640 [Thamnocephalis sphaerospora]|eukprot:RKP09565.1 hypothetical protein THASP1DRAFT_28640 [Thamnocephalis sphaerospora]